MRSCTSSAACSSPTMTWQICLSLDFPSSETLCLVAVLVADVVDTFVAGRCLVVVYSGFAVVAVVAGKDKVVVWA